MKKRSSDGSGFTLTELLVVVAIIAILMALALPVFRGVSDSAKSTKCLNNMRQIVQLVLIYAAENNNAIPPGRWNGGRGDNTWYSNLTPYLETGTSVNQAEYNAPWKKLECPSQDVSHFNLVQGVPRTYGLMVAIDPPWGYGYASGWGLSDWNTGKTRKISELTSPAVTLGFCDTANTEYLYANAFQKLTPPERIHYLPARHQDGYNGVFMDGHAEFLPAKRVQDADDPMWKAVW